MLGGGEILSQGRCSAGANARRLARQAQMLGDSLDRGKFSATRLVGANARQRQMLSRK